MTEISYLNLSIDDNVKVVGIDYEIIGIVCWASKFSHIRNVEEFSIQVKVTSSSGYSDPYFNVYRDYNNNNNKIYLLDKNEDPEYFL